MSDSKVQRSSYDVEKRERLRIMYEGLVDSKGRNEEFEFEGNSFVMAYAKYFLEYLDARLPAAHTLEVSQVLLCDIDESPITDEFYDGRLHGGTTFAYLCPKCWPKFGCGILGKGNGGHYRKRGDGKFVKVG